MTLRKAILALFVVTVLGGVYYYTSDVGKARIEEMHKRYAEWTPKNVEKNTDLYFNATEKELERTLQIALSTEREMRASTIKFQNEATKFRNKVEEARAELTKLQAFGKTSTTVWPVRWQDRELDETAYRNQVHFFAKSVEAKQNELKIHVDNARIARQTEDEARKHRADIQKQLAMVQSRKNAVRVKEMNEQLRKQMEKVQSAVDATLMDLTEDTDMDRLLGVDDLVMRKTVDEVTDEDYQKALEF